MKSPQIDCGVCTLRPFEPGDAESITPLLNDRDVWLNVSDRIPHPYLLEHAEAFIGAAVDKNPVENFAICVDGRAVGGIGIVPGKGISRVSAEIGYWLGKPYWRRGITAAAVKAITKYAVETFDLTRVFAIVFTHNSGSIRVLENAGYVREGLMKQSAIKDGVVQDEYLYGWYVER